MRFTVVEVPEPLSWTILNPLGAMRDGIGVEDPGREAVRPQSQSRYDLYERPGGS